MVDGRGLIEREAAVAFLTRVASEAETEPRMVVITGEAGIGKSRLAAEFATSLGDRSVVRVTGYVTDPTGGDVVDPATLTARTEPPVVVADDLQWLADSAGPDLWRAVRGAGAGLVLATYRVGAHEPGSAVQRAVASLLRHPDVHELRLDPLSPAGVDRMVAMLGGTRDIVDAYERTGGNPFYVEELVSARGSHSWTLTESVLHRLSTLGDAAVEVAERLAVAGRPLPGAVVSGDPSADDGLRRLLDAGLAEVVGARVRLRHALVGEVVEARLGPSRRGEIHRVLAAGMEAAGGDEPEQVAIHWAESGDQERAAVWFARSVDDVLRLRSRITELEEPAEMPSPTSDGERFEMAAVHHARLGNLGWALDWATAAEHAYRSEGRGDRASAVWEQPALRGLSATRVWVADRSPGSIDDLLERSRSALEHGDVSAALRAAAAAADALGPDSPADHRVRCAGALLAAGDVHASEAVVAELQRIAFDEGDHNLSALCLERQAWVAYGRGQPGTAVALMTSARSLADLARHTFRWQMIDVILAFLQASQGELAAARTVVERLLDEVPFGVFGNIPLALVDFEAGCGPDAVERLAAYGPAVEALQSDHERMEFLAVHTALAAMHQGSGRPAEALAIVQRCRSADIALFSPTRPDRLMTEAAAALAVGDRATAETAVGALRDHGRTFSTPGARGAASVGDALLAAADGRMADALAASVAAARDFERAPRWTLAAEAWCSAAEAALALGSDAGPMLAAAEAICRTRCLGRVGARVEVLRRRAPTPAGATSPRLDDLTARELEVVRLVAVGLTNRQIAERLFLSEGTVGNYLSRAYTKLGVSRRAEVAHLLTSRRGEVLH